MRTRKALALYRRSDVLRTTTRLALARVVLFATLFAAASPTFAATIFFDRPIILAKLLGLPGAGSSTHVSVEDEEHSHEHARDAHLAPANPHDGDEHEAHGIYCSFCLGASSVVAVVAGAPGFFPHAEPALAVSAPEDPFRGRRARLVYHARAPPLFS